MIDDNNSAVLGDFGIAVVGNQTTGRGETEESPKKQNWCAPERLAIDLFHQPGVDMREVSSRLKPPVDVYAFGLLCHLV
jgi:serine/threonine protein kinase